MSLLDDNILEQTNICNRLFPKEYDLVKSDIFGGNPNNFVYEWYDEKIFDKKFHGIVYPMLLIKIQPTDQNKNIFKISMAVFNKSLNQVTTCLKSTNIDTVSLIHFIKLPCEDYCNHLTDALDIAYKTISYIRDNFGCYYWLFDNAINYPSKIYTFNELKQKYESTR